MILKSVKFIFILVVLYLVSTFALMQINLGSTTLMKLATRNPVIPGEFGFTVERFRDIENYGDIDILFLGSSHSYRTFDTRIYTVEFD